MTLIFSALAIYTSICLIYWAMYILIRPKVSCFGLLRWKITFILNLVYAIILEFILPIFGMYVFNIFDYILAYLLLALVPFTILHHLSVFHKGRRIWKLTISEAHGPISHLGTFIIIGLCAYRTLMLLFPYTRTGLDTAVLFGYVSMTGFLSFFGILVGLKKFKLPW